MRAIIVALIILSSLCIAATCSQQQIAQVLVDGTDIVLEERQETDFLLVLDQSGSMRGEKLDRAKQAAIDLTSQLARGDRAAIIGFDTRPHLYTPFTNDTSRLSSAIQQITAGDFTRYTPALQEALSQHGDRRTVLIFMSDGKPDDTHAAIMDATSELIDEQVCIFAIAYADSADEQAQQILSGIAQESASRLDCGQYFRAGENDFELSYTFEQIYNDIAAEDAFDVATQITVDEATYFDIDVSSSFNGIDALENACLNPSLSLIITSNRETVYDQQLSSPSVQVSLPAGEYEYFVQARETCDDSCLYLGEDSGSFVVESSGICKVSSSELGVLLTSTDYVEVQITDEGFNPQTVGTEGTVQWTNLDDTAHQIMGADGTWSSPILRPGDSWRHIFPPGEYSYIDTERSFAAAISNENVEVANPVDVALVVDRSGSMAGSPLRSATEAAKNFIQVLTPADRGAIITFSDTARTEQSLTSSRLLLDGAIDRIRSQGSTYYIDALERASSQFDRNEPDRARIVIFLSDGLPFDQGGRNAIIDTVRSEFDDVCLYAIGYGAQGLEAAGLLRDMAAAVDEQTGCGRFFASRAEKQELSRVFGEIYASTQDPQLEVYDVRSEQIDRVTEIRARVRSMQNGVQLPSANEFGCLPPAQVMAHFGEIGVTMNYQYGEYVGRIDLPPGEHVGFVEATVNAVDAPSRVFAGSSTLSVEVEGRPWWIFGVILAALVVIAYVFKSRSRAPDDDTGDSNVP